MSNLATHSCSFLMGKNWHSYKYLEGRLLETSRYITFAPENLSTWSENLADLLSLIGSAVDTFFRNMWLCPAIRNLAEVKAVEILDDKSNRKNWNINDFMNAYEPIYELSKNEVTVPFGLSSLGSRKPFEKFGSRNLPVWWDGYNHVKHGYYDNIKEANLGNVVDALGGLLILNALHKDSQEYLLDVGVLNCGGLTPSFAFEYLKRSNKGIPKMMLASQCTIVTPIFVFELRKDY